MKFLMYKVKFSAFVNCGSLKKKHYVKTLYDSFCFVMFLKVFYAAYFGEKFLSTGHQPYTSQVPLDLLSRLTHRPLMMPEGKQIDR